jgi:hypothetical protein
MVLDILSSFQVFEAVPLEGSASYSEIASKTGIPEDMARRIIRHSMTQRIFAETAPGSNQVVHTATSALFLKNPKWHSWVGHNLDEVNRASTYMTDSIRRFGDGNGEPGLCAATLALCPDIPKETSWFQWAATDGEGDKKGWRMHRFSEAMEVISTGQNATAAVHGGFDWKSLPSGGTIVDVSLLVPHPPHQ